MARFVQISQSSAQSKCQEYNSIRCLTCYKVYVSNVNTTVYVYGYILLYYTEYNMIIIVYNTVYIYIDIYIYININIHYSG